jgi:hypothetical protein
VGYSLYDFTETLDRLTDISPLKIGRVLAAWGHSPEGCGSWEGGFLLERAEGGVQYVSGWCDTSGWG